MIIDKDYNGLKYDYSANLQSFGQNGFKIVTTSLIEGDFVAVTAIEDSVITLTIPEGMNADAPVNMPLPIGLTIYGKFTSAICSSGKVLAYNLTGE